MAGLWGLYSYRQQAGHSDIPYPPVFYLYLIPDNGFPPHCIHDHGLLGKYEELYPERQKESTQVFIAPISCFTS